ncbi:MAG: adenine phosphoribosyltransferase [Thermoprotei archaeon]|nr:MAG: adenine phosphoribosyltransferase [Thermoprotei archaeon]RLF00850.1 MAG: adenine phosphoribosyltransferase [Thermoprotei archaeon]
MPSKLEHLRLKLVSIEVLKALKKEFSYDELSPIFNLSPSLLSQYINGRILPGAERAKEIIDKFYKELLPKLLDRKIRVTDGIIDVSKVISDTQLLSLVASVAVGEFNNVDKVLTIETDGIPLAVLIAEKLGVGIAIAKHKKEIGVREFIEVKRVFPSGIYSYLYLPKSTLKPGENILIVDDIVRSGATISALLEACRITKSVPIGVFALIVVRKTADKIARLHSIPVKALKYI